jgi:hypothetical protein
LIYFWEELSGKYRANILIMAIGKDEIRFVDDKGIEMG